MLKQCLIGITLYSFSAFSCSADSVKEEVRPEAFCYKPICEKVAKVAEWPDKGKIDGVTLGSYHFTFIVPAPDNAIRAVGTEGAGIVYKDGKRLSFNVSEGPDNLTSALDYTFSTSVKDLPKQLPVNISAASILYNIKSMFAADSQLKKYQKENWIVYAGLSSEVTSLVIANKKYSHQVLFLRLKNGAENYLNQILNSLELDKVH
ncbi:hypothetical protein [Spartinivicinus ruber]|uniref:hypothetical protein n=1 Tax=Spartinivicinus ruber TaxID=2683272 RepID=UPI0013CF7ED1|nr:hypothetical protein [Spartinivicinus ruber]